MTSESKDEIQKDELEEQNGEELPEREVMSIVSVDPQPVEVLHPADGPLPGQDPGIEPDPPQE